MSKWKLIVHILQSEWFYQVENQPESNYIFVYSLKIYMLGHYLHILFYFCQNFQNR